MPSPFPPGARVIAYLRDSGGDEQELSIPQQEAALRLWTAQNHLVLTRIYTDQARPGSTTVGRDGFLAMLAHLRDPASQETGLLIWKYSRFSRDVDDAAFYKADLRRRGLTIHSLNDNIPEGPEGRFFEAAIDWMNQRFLDDLSTDVKRGLHHLVQTYRAVPGTPPKGFRRVPVAIGPRRTGQDHVVHRWEPDPDLIPLVQKAFALRAAGASYKQIADQVPLYRSKNSWPTFFTNQLYIGVLQFGDLTIPDYCAPLIDPETWRLVQLRTRINRTTPNTTRTDHPRRSNPNYLLSGLLHCAHCGAPMNGHTVQRRTGHRWTYYTCNRKQRRRDCPSRHIPQQTIETAVIHELHTHILQPANLAQILAQVRRLADQQTTEHQQTRTRLQARLTNLQRRLANVAGAIEESGQSPTLLARLAQLELDQADLLSQLEQLAAPAPDLPDLTPAQIAAWSSRLIASLQQDPLELRQTLQGLIHRITAERQASQILGLIEYHLPPPKKAVPGVSRGPYAYGITPLGGTIHRHKFSIPVKP